MYTIPEYRYEGGTWVVRYSAEYDGTGAASDYTKLSGDVYMWVFEGGTLYFATQSYYDTWIMNGSAGGSTGSWTYDETDGFVFNLNSTPMDMTENDDGTVTITGTSSVWGTFTVTLDTSSILEQLASAEEAA